MTHFKKSIMTTTAGVLAFAAHMAQADQQFLDDVIVDGSLCVGQDCVNGESFGFDTIRLKENNLRIRAQDTSNSASFPTRDWQITFNDSTNGGANKFSIDDIDGGRTPFTIEAGAPSHSLYVDDGGRIGFGTSTPVVELHAVNGDTPTLRLEQDGSSGFGAQTFDIASNEANFFIRDATNGSQLPFRIEPGADTNALVLDATNRIGIGTNAPTASLEVTGSGGTTQILVDENSGTAAARTMLVLENNGSPGISLLNTANTRDWRIQQSGGNMQMTLVGSGRTEFNLDTSGNLTIGGNITATTAGSSIPDYVFAPDYELMPLYEVEKFIIENSHLPKIPSAAEVGANGLNMTEMQIALLEKVEELTLYTLDQQKRIDAMQAEIDSLSAD